MPLLKGSSKGVISSNIKALRKREGKSEDQSIAIAYSVAGEGKKSHPNRHKNLKGFLHPKKAK